MTIELTSEEAEALYRWLEDYPLEGELAVFSNIQAQLSAWRRTYGDV